MFETKKCCRCKTIKTLTEFSISKINNDGFSYTCKTCAAEASQNWRMANKERNARYQKQYLAKNISKIYIQRSKNIEKIRERDRIRNTKKSSTLKGALDNRIRTGVNYSLKRGVKNGRRWAALVGYDLDSLKAHLEKQFKDGMTWERFVKGEIHLDHKIPKSVFQL